MTTLTKNDVLALIEAAKEYQSWNSMKLTRSPEVRRDWLAAETFLHSPMPLEREIGIRLVLFSDTMAELAAGGTKLHEGHMGVLASMDRITLPEELFQVWDGMLLAEALRILQPVLASTSVESFRALARLAMQEKNNGNVVFISGGHTVN